MIIAVKIDVMKVDKSKLFPGKNGAKYLDLILLENRDGKDQYGNDFMVCRHVSKEEREKGVKGAILGNARILSQKPAEQPKQRPERQQEQPREDDDIPF